MTVADWEWEMVMDRYIELRAVVEAQNEQILDLTQRLEEANEELRYWSNR